jgi:hypothetical protein
MLIPFILSANMGSLKRELKLKSKETLLNMSENHLMNYHFYLCGRNEALFEILLLIEKMEMESGAKEK